MTEVTLALAVLKMGMEVGKFASSAAKNLSDMRAEQALIDVIDGLVSAEEGLEGLLTEYENEDATTMLRRVRNTLAYIEENREDISACVQAGATAIEQVQGYFASADYKAFQKRQEGAISRFRVWEASKRAAAAMAVSAFAFMAVGCMTAYSREYIAPEGDIASIEVPFGVRDATNIPDGEDLPQYPAISETDEEGYVHYVYRIPRDAKPRRYLRLPF